MSYSVWIKVESDDEYAPESDPEAWWTTGISRETRDEAIAEAEEIALALNKMGMDVERIED